MHNSYRKEDTWLCAGFGKKRVFSVNPNSMHVYSLEISAIDQAAPVSTSWLKQIFLMLRIHQHRVYYKQAVKRKQRKESRVHRRKRTWKKVKRTICVLVNRKIVCEERKVCVQVKKANCPKNIFRYTLASNFVFPCLFHRCSIKNNSFMFLIRCNVCPLKDVVSSKIHERTSMERHAWIGTSAISVHRQILALNYRIKTDTGMCITVKKRIHACNGGQRNNRKVFVGYTWLERTSTYVFSRTRKLIFKRHS